jgi:hypothetical protein
LKKRKNQKKCPNSRQLQPTKLAPMLRYFPHTHVQTWQRRIWQLQRFSTRATTSTVEYLQPGLVVVRDLLSKHQQVDLTQSSCALGLRDPPLGFFEPSGALNSRPYRGRIYSSVQEWPAWINQTICNDSVQLARQEDQTIPTMTCTHILLLCYMNSAGVGWHRDIYENDGEANKPVVTLNLGNSCDFIFKDDHETEKTFITLHSGDCLLFGGPKRHAMVSGVGGVRCAHSGAVKQGRIN